VKASKPSYQRNILLGFHVFHKPCALLYTSLVAAIDYQSIIGLCFVELY